MYTNSTMSKYIILRSELKEYEQEIKDVKNRIKRHQKDGQRVHHRYEFEEYNIIKKEINRILSKRSYLKALIKDQDIWHNV